MLEHGHFADFNDVSDPATLNKSELPSGVLILALQAVGLYPLSQAAVYCSDHLVRFTMLSAHGALERSSKTPLQRAFFGRYIWQWNLAWGWSQWEDEGCPHQHCITIPPHHQGSHIGSLDQDFQPHSWNIRAGKEEEMKQIGFITGKLTGGWLQGGGNPWIYTTLRLNTLFHVCVYMRYDTGWYLPPVKGIQLYRDNSKDTKDSLRKDEAISLRDVDCLPETPMCLWETCTLLFKDVTSFMSLASLHLSKDTKDTQRQTCHFPDEVH